jgi:hypothetical protein
MNDIDKSLCPLCQKNNNCALESKESKGAEKTCWCMQTTVSDEVLAKVPADKKAKACICQSCLKVY